MTYFAMKISLKNITVSKVQRKYIVYQIIKEYYRDGNAANKIPILQGFFFFFNYVNSKINIQCSQTKCDLITLANWSISYEARNLK